MSNTQIRYALIVGIIIYLVWSTIGSRKTNDLEKDLETLNRQAVVSSVLNLITLLYLLLRF